jgi:hypothetical protein
VQGECQDRPLETHETCDLTRLMKSKKEAVTLCEQVVVSSL